MDFTSEQLKAAYALNLCTVSVSQIIDYNDVNIMEQEYEAILNNLNLEQMPKDEALLSILKQILDTITFFRIQDIDKQLVEKEYQQKMKNAIWSAVPNIGLLVAGGSPITMAISLASQVGIGYMNYRKAKADISLEVEKKRWELERTAIEQFNGLRRELFDTAWRLSASYNFPDQLRLTERQIKQYNAILMDNDLIRKYDRLAAIQEAFVAYPPFWYHFGNTANAISRSDLRLSDGTRGQYRKLAKEHLIQYRKSNQYGLLREDPVSASCALELIDLLDYHNDKELIRELITEAISYSGRANDVLQLASIAYLKLNDSQNAARILRQLVNEQYNTILNAQLLSSIYVHHFIESKSIDSLSRYEILRTQVGGCYLYPLPPNEAVSMENIDAQFVSIQKQVLREKYVLVFRAFIEKYLVRFGKLIPVVDYKKDYIDAYFLGSEYAIEMRKHEFAKVFSNSRKTSDYIIQLQEAAIPYAILDLMNEMFEACCSLDLMTENVQARLANHIEKAIISNKKRLNEINERIRGGQVDYIDMEKLLSIRFVDFTTEFFRDLMSEIDTYIDSRKEMQDFAIAEENLVAFCEKNNIPDPTVLFGKDGNNMDEIPEITAHRFDIGLLGNKPITTDDEISNEQSMLSIIRDTIPRIVVSCTGAGLAIAHADVEFFTSEDPRKERYFRSKEKLKSNSKLMASTLAILDDKSKKGDYDLLFTVYGLVAIKGGVVKSPIAYGDVTWINGKTKYLNIDGKFENPVIDSEMLYALCQALKKYAKPMPTPEASFKLPEFKNPFAKK